MKLPLENIELNCTRDSKTVTRKIGISNLFDDEGEWSILIRLPTTDEPVQYFGCDALSCIGIAYMHLYSVMNYLDREGWKFEFLDGSAFRIWDYFPCENSANETIDHYDCEIGDKSMIEHRDRGRKYY